MLCLGLKKSLLSPRLKLTAQGMAQPTDDQSWVWYHSAIQAPLCFKNLISSRWVPDKNISIRELKLPTVRWYSLGILELYIDVFNDAYNNFPGKVYLENQCLGSSERQLLIGLYLWNRYHPT